MSGSEQAGARRPGRRRVSLRAAILAVVVGVAAAVALGWAGAVVFLPPKVVQDTSGYATTRVQDGTVGWTISLNAVATWPSTATASNRAIGVITTVPYRAGTTATQGTTLYTVNLRPTVVAQGKVPMFRTLADGTSGDDVAELQSMLLSLGYGVDDQSGTFGASTAAAVKAWHTDLGIEGPAEVEPGDILVLPRLPARLRLTSVIRTGADLAASASAVQVLAATPQIQLPVTANQAALIPEHAPVTLEWHGHRFTGVTGTRTNANDNVQIALQTKNGGVICGSSCGTIPATASTTIDTTITIVPEQRGLVVPSAAIRTMPDGTFSVLTDKRRSVKVQVGAQANGLSIVSGVKSGQSVLVPKA